MFMAPRTAEGLFVLTEVGNGSVGSGISFAKSSGIVLSKQEQYPPKSVPVDEVFQLLSSLPAVVSKLQGTLWLSVSHCGFNARTNVASFWL